MASVTRLAVTAFSASVLRYAFWTTALTPSAVILSALLCAQPFAGCFALLLVVFTSGPLLYGPLVVRPAVRPRRYVAFRIMNSRRPMRLLRNYGAVLRGSRHDGRPMRRTTPAVWRV